MNYKAILTQAGEGCVNTIGCGQRTVDLKSNTVDDAKTELYELILEDYTGDEYRLEEAVLVQYVHKVDLITLYKSYDDSLVEQEEKDEREREYKEFLKLKAKYENE